MGIILCFQGQIYWHILPTSHLMHLHIKLLLNKEIYILATLFDYFEI